MGNTCQTVKIKVKYSTDKGGVTMTEFWASILWLVVGMVIGGALGFFFTRRAMEKQIKENPPINEKMIRAMFMQMGRKPSEAQIRQIMKSMGQ
jgi:uncharacterized protein YneF (UPF0154 family)